MGDMIAAGCYNGKIHLLDAATGAVKRSLNGHLRYVTAVSYSCLFSNVWCVLTIEHFIALSVVSASVQMVSKWPVEAGTKL
jgi:hypothetical protein